MCVIYLVLFTWQYLKFWSLSKIQIMIFLTLHHCPVEEVLSTVLLCLILVWELDALSNAPDLVFDSYALPPFVSFLLVMIYVSLRISWLAPALFKAFVGLLFTFVGLCRLLVLVDSFTGDFLSRFLTSWDVSWPIAAFSESSVVFSLLIASSLDGIDGFDSSSEESVEIPGRAEALKFSFWFTIDMFEK